MPEKVDLRPLRPDPIISGHDRMPPGTRYRRPGGLDHHLIVLTLGGEGAIGPTTGKFTQHSGDIILFQPRAPVDQDVKPTRSWSRLWMIFDPRPHWHHWLAWPEVSPGISQLHLPSVRRGSAVRDCLESAHRHATGAMRRRGELAMNALEAALLWCDAHNPRGEQARLDPRITQAMDFISTNLRQRLSLQQIAEAAGLSMPHVVKLFRRQLDLSPMQFVERQRMQRAVQLLQMTPQSVSKIAAQVGFDDPFYFSTRFKRHTGRSPRGFRGNIP